MSQTKVKSGLISDQSITASKLYVTGNGNSGEVLASAGDGSFVWTSGIATEAYTDNAISNIIDGAPGALDTLNELAAALGDDANFASTVTTALGTKVDGTGTTNYISKWLDSDTITNSVIYDNGTNVGIGTSSPATELHIASASPILTLQDTNSTEPLQTYIQFTDSASNVHSYIGMGSGVTDDFKIVNYYDDISFYTGTGGSTSERMRILSSGNVGIGASNPSVKLQVNGIGEFAGALRITEGGTAQSILIGNQDSGGVDKPSIIMGVNGALRFGWGSTWNGEGGTFTETLQLKNNGDAYFTGNVGIGTTIPSTPLVISKNSPVSGTMLILQNTLYGSTNSSGLNSIEFGWLNHTAAKISANKESVNRTGFIITGEVGYNVPVEIARFTSFGDLHVNQDVIAYSTTISDERLKDNIVTIDNALDKVCELRGVEYDWNASSRSGQHDMGVIAQEVEKVFPFIVREKEMPLVDGNTYKTVDYEKLVGVLIEAVKELKQEIEILKSK